MGVVETLLDSPGLAGNRLAERLLPILVRPTGVSTSGYPYLQREAWELFRDRIPHILAMGKVVDETVQGVEEALAGREGDDEDNVRRSCKVVRQVVLTATITAPPCLWLLRHVLGAFAELGLLQRMLAGEAIYVDACSAPASDGVELLDPSELETDLSFLLSLGLVEQYEESYRIAGHPRVRRVFESIEPVGDRRDPAQLWRQLFAGKRLSSEQQEQLLDLSFKVSPRTEIEQNHWIPTLEEIELGFRLVPVVLGLRAAERTTGLVAGLERTATELSADHPLCAAGALEILTAAGWMERDGEHYRVTRIGERGFARGPGPFGIIHTYHPYMSSAVEILESGSASVWVRRGENVAASQDANRGTFAKANDALDRFCADTGFQLRVFIEHAIGRGEATRQRFERSGEETIRYFGADLEDAAIDAAIAEQGAGRLPSNMVFVRDADIGRPEVLLAALAREGVSSRGAVMLVGNGFHEIREQDDDSMVRVFEGYCQAGVILLFTEENALAIDDLRATAWNTYHAGFKYVHEKSGQGLRPALPRERVPRLGRPLRAPWSACASAAGYVRATAYCSRTRTVYPYTPRTGRNPSISVNHFFVPEVLAQDLGIARG